MSTQRLELDDYSANSSNRIQLRPCTHHAAVCAERFENQGERLFEPPGCSLGENSTTGRRLYVECQCFRSPRRPHTVTAVDKVPVVMGQDRHQITEVGKRTLPGLIGLLVSVVEYPRPVILVPVDGRSSEDGPAQLRNRGFGQVENTTRAQMFMIRHFYAS